MRWFRPPYLWLSILPLLVCVTSIASEFLRRRRLREFGEPAVLGISLRWLPPITTMLLLTAGMAAVSAIPSASFQSSIPPYFRGPLIQIVVDSLRPASAEAGPSRDEVEAQVRSVLQVAPASSYFTVVRPGEPIENMVPETRDRDGLLLLVNRALFEAGANAGASLGRALQVLLVPQAAREFSPLRVVVLTARPGDELADIEKMLGSSRADVLFVRLSPQTGTEWTSVNRRNWLWSHEIKKLSRFLAEPSSQRDRSSEWKRTQVLSVFAFLVLTAEFISSFFLRKGGL